MDIRFLGVHNCESKNTKLTCLLIDDVPLNTIQIPGFDGLWIVVIYPGEEEQYVG